MPVRRRKQNGRGMMMDYLTKKLIGNVMGRVSDHLKKGKVISNLLSNIPQNSSSMLGNLVAKAGYGRRRKRRVVRRRK